MERRVIYVTHQGARVHRMDGMLAVSVDGHLVDRWPAVEIDRVLLFGNVQITTQVLALLLREGVHASFFSSAGHYRGQIVSPESGNVFARLAQHSRYGDLGFRLAFARELVLGKLGAATGLLGRYGRNHADATVTMDQAIARIEAARAQVAAVDTLESLRGLEGTSAAAYFQAFDQMVRPPFRFERRSKHPAHNPVNALLNLGYTLLTGEIASRLESVGLDPRIGYYHGVRYGRSSLALDLIEAHRADVVDRLTLSVLNRRMFAPDDFEDHGDAAGVRLTSSALRRYLGLYEVALGEAPPGRDTPRTRIQEQVSLLRRRLLSGDPLDGAAPTAE